MKFYHLNQHLNQHLKQLKKQTKKHLYKFWDKTVNYERNINTGILNDYFKYHDPSFLLKDLHNVNETENEKIVGHINNVLIDLRNAVIRGKIPINENPDKVIDIVEEILNFNKRQKGKGLLPNSRTKY